ncbi:MAG: DUF2203 domain-containing protein [Chloroflexota bacterium]|nr:DUF2203 domain-containing protein [Anaerolineales bacterium]
MNMATKYFTVAEVNALLPQLEPMLGQLLERRARVVRQGQQMSHVLGDMRSNVGGADASAMVQDFMVIESLLDQIKAYGCEVKDLNAGLLDFLAEIDGREVYLCWKYGESEVLFYHDLQTGFNGRIPL